MKVASKKATALIEGEVESVKMSVSEKGMDKMCRFLRDDIYTYKEWAVVREILANAVDEHAMHGVTRPVEVALPTFADPHFRVRDFAKGLSKDKVFSVFFQYFESTKDKDNANIGGFGIGAKSPLAYADMFFVDSYHEGVKTSYASNINGEASVAHKMGLVDTSETGIEVAVPVEQNDFEKFAQLVGEFIHFGDYQDTIKVLNDELIEYPESKWQLVNEFGKTGHSKTMFKGQSYRPIFGRIKGILYKLPETNEIDNPFYNDLIVNLDPELDWDIHPSRERLQVTKRNILLIKQAIEKFVQSALADTKKKLSAAKTAREKFAVEFDRSAFRGNQMLQSLELPEKLSCEAKGVEYISWSANNFDRYKCNKMHRSHYGNTTFSFTPLGFKSNLSDWARDNQYHKTEGSILLVATETLRTFDVIAFAEKNNVPSPLFVFRTNEAPKGWVEGADHWVLREDSLTKDEVAAIRKRYTPQGSAKRSSTGSGIPASEVIGYKTYYRSTRNVIRMQDIDDSKKIAVIPLAQSRQLADSVPRFFDYCRENIKETHNLLYCFQAQINRLNKAKVEYDVVNADFLKDIAQEYVNSNQSVERMEVRQYSVDYAGYKLHSHPNEDILSAIEIDYPNMKVTKENPVIDKLREAEKRYQALTDLEKETIKTLSDWAGGHFPLIREHAKSILKDKVFI